MRCSACSASSCCSTSRPPGAGSSSPGTAGHQQAELQELQREHDELRARLRALKAPGAIEREARRLGMVKVGERSFVIENLGR